MDEHMDKEAADPAVVASLLAKYKWPAVFGGGILGSLLGYGLMRYGKPHPGKSERLAMAGLSDRLVHGGDPDTILKEMAKIETGDAGQDKTAGALESLAPAAVSTAGMAMLAGYPLAYVKAKSDDKDTVARQQDMVRDWEAKRKAMSDRSRQSILNTLGISEEDLAEAMSKESNEIADLAARIPDWAKLIGYGGGAAGLGTAGFLIGKKSTDKTDPNNQALNNYIRTMEEAVIHSGDRPLNPLSGVFSPGELAALDNLRRNPKKKTEPKLLPEAPSISAEPSNPELQQLLASV